ncbi:MAG: glycosyltransferase involved in cell wall biosynthesis [Roseivirga sp.]|jgi:glycosyltransferase involved in cell wall biosynthesis
MKGKRVLLIHNILWSHYKGVVFSHFSREVNSAGGELLVLQTALTASGQRDISEVDTSIHKYSYFLLFDDSLENTSMRERYQAFKGHILSFKPDVVILPGYADRAIWLLSLYLKMNSISFIQTCDSTIHDHRRIWHKEAVKSILLNTADLVFCYGEVQKEYLETLSIPADKIHFRVQATDNKKYIDFAETKTRARGASGEVLRLLYVGRLSPEKNLPFLIRCLAKVGLRVKLSIVGAGPDQLDIENLIRDLGMSDSMKLLGSVPWDEVIEYYLSHDVFILPSISEPWGLVVNEAMLCKLPVLVSSNCGCSRDLVKEGVNGFTFNPFTEEDLVAKINLLIQNFDQLPEWGRASFEMIQEYNPGRSAKQMLRGVELVVNSLKRG